MTARTNKRHADSDRKRRARTRKSAAARSRQLVGWMRRSAELNKRYRAERSDELRSRRADRSAELRAAQLSAAKRHAERAAAQSIPLSADELAATTAAAAKRRADKIAQRAELVAIRCRDEWLRTLDSHRWGTNELALVVWERAERVVPDNRDELRNDASAALLVAIAARYGWQPQRDEVTLSYIDRRLSGYVANARQRAAQRDASAEWEAMLSADDDERDELRSRAKRNVWSAFIAPENVRELRAAELATDELRELLALSDNASAALESALAGYGSAREYAAAAGITESTARKRLQRGRDELRDKYGNAAELVAALRAAYADDDERYVLTADERRAAQLVAAAQRAAAVAAKRGSYAPVGSGRWHGVRPGCAPSVFPLVAAPALYIDERQLAAAALAARDSDEYRSASQRQRNELVAAAERRLRDELAARHAERVAALS